MGDSLFAFLLFLTILAVFTRETFVIGFIYILGGAFLLGRWWTNTIIDRLVFQRHYESRVFPGETIQVKVDIVNHSLLPIVWLRIQDYFPLDLADTRSFQQVISFAPKEKKTLQYFLKAHKRGLYSIGPLLITTGDLLGMSRENNFEGHVEKLIVYPQIIPLNKVELPSSSPMGTLKTSQPIFEDPSRPMGTRDYQAGDSLRRIDWKATAASGKLQTRIFEPSIALETMIFLNLNTTDYYYRTRFDAVELAIVVAASLGHWISNKRQSVGLCSNGVDPLTDDHILAPMLPKKGRGHFMRILEVLARVRASETSDFSTLISHSRVKLSWGTTLLVISGSADQAIFGELIQCKKAGLNPVLILCGEHPGLRHAIKAGKLFKIPVHSILNEHDLDVWRA